MRISLGLPAETVGGGASGVAELCSADGISEMARAVESAGFDAVYVTDHPCPPASWLAAGGHRALDPLVALAVAAAATTTVRLQTNMLVLPYRNPLLAAAQVASLDAISGGRVILGVAAGYLAGEFSALGADVERRNDALDDAIAALRAAWAHDEFSHDAPTLGYSARRCSVFPTPAVRHAAPAGPPVWIGGNSMRAMRRAVAAGDGWVPFPTPPSVATHLRTAAIETLDDLAERIRRVRELEDAAGRATPLDICVVPFGSSMLDDRHGGVDAAAVAALRAGLADLAGLGVTWATISLPAHSLDAWIGDVKALGAELAATLA